MLCTKGSLSGRKKNQVAKIPNCAMKIKLLSRAKDNVYFNQY